LPWKAFDDTGVLNLIQQPLGIISNWDKSLPEKLASFFDVQFQWIIGSENEGIKKPNPLFFEKILEQTKLQPSEILYVGDSVKLDLEPARKLGINAFLIDRENYFPCQIYRINSFFELENLISK
jgi:FMN phosphatase YigB (HAD superfamily)